MELELCSQLEHVRYKTCSFNVCAGVLEWFRWSICLHINSNVRYSWCCANQVSWSVWGVFKVKNALCRSRFTSTKSVYGTVFLRVYEPLAMANYGVTALVAKRSCFCVPRLYLWGSPFWVKFLRDFFHPTIEVVTFHLHGWCMLGVFLVPAFTCLGHECQDLLNSWDGMHVFTD